MTTQNQSQPSNVADGFRTIGGYEPIRNGQGQIVFWCKVKEEEKLIIFSFYPDRADEERVRLVLRDGVEVLKVIARCFGYALIDTADICQHMRVLARIQREAQ